MIKVLKTEETDMKQCPNCHVGNKKNAKKCWYCGIKLPSLKKLKEIRIAATQKLNLIDGKRDKS